MTEASKILVTGGAGLVGSTLVRRLLRGGAEVVAFDRDTSSPVLRSLGAAGALRLVEGDITDGATMRGLFDEARPDTVVHLASVLGPDCRAQPRLCAEVNCMATLSVLEECERLGVRRVVLASSESVYGPDRFVPSDGRRQPDRPDYPFDAAKLYTMSKLFVEALAEQFAERGLSTCGLRLAMVIGPGRRRGATTAALNASQVAANVSNMIESAALGRSLTVAVCADDEITYLYVEDVAAQLEALCRAPAGAFANRRFFHTGGDRVTLGRVVEEIRTLVPDAPLEVRWVAERSFPGSRVAMSDDELRGAVGVSRTFLLRDGIAAHVSEVRRPSDGGL